MRYLFTFMCVCALGLVLGCSDDGGGTGGSGGTAGTGGGGTGGTPAEVRSYQFNFSGVAPDGSVPPLEGVTVCQADTENCATTDELGGATLDVPANQEIIFTAEKAEYGRWLTAASALTETTATRRLYTEEQLEAVAAQLQTDYPWTGGIVGLVRNPSLQDGVTFTPVGSTVDAVGDSFYYDAATEEYSLDLEATTSTLRTWFLPLGAGGFTEVTEGEQQFEFGGAAGDCQPSWAWPGDGPNQIRVPVRAGYQTYASMICDEQ